MNRFYILPTSVYAVLLLSSVAQESRAVSPFPIFTCGPLEYPGVPSGHTVAGRGQLIESESIFTLCLPLQAQGSPATKPR